MQVHMVQHPGEPSAAYHVAVAIEDRDEFEAVYWAGRAGGRLRARDVPAPHLRAPRRGRAAVHARAGGIEAGAMTEPIGGMHHVGIVVRDLEMAETFVTRALGLPVVKRLASASGCA